MENKNASIEVYEEGTKPRDGVIGLLNGGPIPLVGDQILLHLPKEERFKPNTDFVAFNVTRRVLMYGINDDKFTKAWIFVKWDNPNA